MVAAVAINYVANITFQELGRLDGWYGRADATEHITPEARHEYAMGYEQGQRDQARVRSQCRRQVDARRHGR